MPEPETFEYIPALNQILAGDGLVGVVYYYVSAANTATAQQAEIRPTDKTEPFYVVGPKGKAACYLMSKGDPILGADTGSTKAQVRVDGDVYRQSGILTPAEVEKQLEDAKRPESQQTVTVRSNETGPVSTPADDQAEATINKTKQGRTAKN